MVEVGKFYKMKDDSLQEYGVSKGDHLYIGGSGFVPDSPSDPYKYRLVFVGVKTKDHHVIIGDQGFTVDARNLSKCNKKDLELLERYKEEDFGGQENPN